MANQDTRTRPNLDTIAHPEVSRAVRVAYDLIYDNGDAIKALVGQLLGGAYGIASVAAGVITIQITAGGYYQRTPPRVVIDTDGTGYSATAILTGNRVTGVTIVQGAGATVATVQFVP